MRRREKGARRASRMRWLFQLSAMMVAIGAEAPEVASPAAAVLARRASRAVLPEQMKVAAVDDSSDEEWSEDEDDLMDDRPIAEQSVDGVVRGRVRLHGVLAQSSAALQVDDDRRKSLAQRGWCRRTLLVHSVGGSGADNLEAVAGTTTV